MNPSVPAALEPAALEHSRITLPAHPNSECAGRPCPIHNRTDHAMRAFPQHWRRDRRLMERICPHGIGHPDPDQWDYFVATLGLQEAAAQFVHGCCGCCGGWEWA